MKSTHRLGSLLLSFLLLIVVIAALINRVAIYDWILLHNYQPSTQISQIAVDDTMTDYARHLFYINHPEIQVKSDFNKDCPNDGGEQTIILGCYHSNQTGIFLFSVTDARLKGVEQVTAAHETLHAAYERLSNKDRTHINSLLEDFFIHDLKDKRIIDTIEAYKKSEPNDVVNEMHSVFGTEVTKLTPELESYYQKYFTSRSKVTSYATAYQKTFVNYKALADKYEQLIKNLESQLSNLKIQIDSKETQLESQDRALEADRNNVTASNVSEFNNRVRQYNAQVQVYRNMINQYNSLIVEHNDLVIKYQAITTENNQLIRELDSRSASVSSQ